MNKMLFFYNIHFYKLKMELFVGFIVFNLLEYIKALNKTIETYKF